MVLLSNICDKFEKCFLSGRVGSKRNVSPIFDIIISGQYRNYSIYNFLKCPKKLSGIKDLVAVFIPKCLLPDSISRKAACRKKD